MSDSEKIDRVATYGYGLLHLAFESGKPACSFINGDAPWQQEPAESWEFTADTDQFPDPGDFEPCDDCSLIWQSIMAHNEPEESHP